MLQFEDMMRMSRPRSGRVKMDRRNRAKQFAPFDALRGFGAAIRDKAELSAEGLMLPEEERVILIEDPETITIE